MDGQEPGKILSFNERHYQKVLEENRHLKERLKELVEIAKANERIQEHLEAVERKILMSRSMTEMAKNLVQELRRRFQLEFVTLCLALEPEDVLWKVQKRPRGGDRRLPPYLRLLSVEELKKALPRVHRRPHLKGRLKRADGPFFPEEISSEIRSRAVIPLWLRRRLIGTLNLGSTDPHRYHSRLSTDFLRRLGCKISLVVDNLLVHQRLLEMSVRDQLTGLYNRRRLEEILSKEVERFRRYGIPFSFMILDMDGFKGINDRYGHEAGDWALRHVARVLRENSRAPDVVARYGGDEFAVLLPHTELRAALRVARKYQRSLKEDPFRFQERPVPLGLSIGLASAEEISSAPPEELIKEADRRLLEAKAQGGGRISSSPPSGPESREPP